MEQSVLRSFFITVTLLLTLSALVLVYSQHELIYRFLSKTSIEEQSPKQIISNFNNQLGYDVIVENGIPKKIPAYYYPAKDKLLLELVRLNDEVYLYKYGSPNNLYLLDDLIDRKEKIDYIDIDNDNNIYYITFNDIVRKNSKKDYGNFSSETFGKLAVSPSKLSNSSYKPTVNTPPVNNNKGNIKPTTNNKQYRS